MANSRNIALNVLMKIEQDKAYSNLALNNAIRENKLNSLDSSFVSALVYGVLERKLTLDYIIKQYSKIPLRKIELKTKMILRLGVLQLVFMDKIPESAAVNESVNLAKKHKLQKSSGFINGILRSITRAEVKYTLPDKADKLYFYSIKYSVPQELVKLWINSYGELNAEQLFQNLSGRPKLFIRVNTLRVNQEDLQALLADSNIIAEPVPFLQNALSLGNTGSIERLRAYKDGLFHVQDLSSQLCVSFLAPKPHEIMLDICSAPGGKAFTSAQYMNDKGKIFSCDLYDAKLRLIQSGAKRLGITSILTAKRDGAEPEVALPIADKILCDVPCSGLGVLSRKPEIRYKQDIISSDLPELQYKILCKSAENLASGGRLVYSTCTLNPAENNENVRRFLSEHPDFCGVPLELPNEAMRAIDEQPYEITLMPHKTGTDGFYIALLEKRCR